LVIWAIIRERKRRDEISIAEIKGDHIHKTVAKSDFEVAIFPYFRFSHGAVIGVSQQLC